MRKTFHIFLCLLLISTFIVVPANAATSDSVVPTISGKTITLSSYQYETIGIGPPKAGGYSMTYTMHLVPYFNPIPTIDGQYFQNGYLGSITTRPLGQLSNLWHCGCYTATHFTRYTGPDEWHTETGIIRFTGADECSGPQGYGVTTAPINVNVVNGTQPSSLALSNCTSAATLGQLFNGSVHVEINGGNYSGSPALQSQWL